MKTSLKESPNGSRLQEGAIPGLGSNGSIVIVCVDPGLAQEMRRVVLPAVCYTHESSSHLNGAVERRAVVVAYCHHDSLLNAQNAASWIERACHAERIGILDLGEMGFQAPPEGFFPWYEEATGNGHYEDGLDFLGVCDRRAKWRPRFSFIGLDEDSGDDLIKDPIGDIDPRAFHGPLGRLAMATQPETEANPVFVLAHLLAFFGATVGRGPYFTVSATRHRLNLFVGLVGPSGISRKGMAGDVATETWRKVEPLFTAENITGGLNSGAGLLWHLRDAMPKRGKQPADEGVRDKRRVFLESELASVLKQGHRECDPMTEHLRRFFDGDEVIRSNVRNDPLKVTGGHVSLIGHCTPADLDIHLTDVDKANGTANRFIWLFGVRSKLLSRGGDVFGLLDFLGADLQEVERALGFTRDVREIRRDRDAEARWDALYKGEWNDVPPGRLGVFFVRAAPQVMRMASVYALADQSATVRIEHLEAALAVWDHSARSLRFVFGADADPNAEKLLAGLKAGPEEGLTRREIANDVFSKNKDAETIDQLLSKLLAYRLILQGQATSTPKGGRPAPRYRLNQW